MTGVYFQEVADPGNFGLSITNATCPFCPTAPATTTVPVGEPTKAAPAVKTSADTSVLAPMLSHGSTHLWLSRSA